MENKQRTACLILIGNELLSGRTQDENLAYVAKGLNKHGVRLCYVHVIPDDKEIIASTINENRVKYDFVFTTGGIGPTHDDITAEAVAYAFGVDLEPNPEAVKSLRAHYNENDLNPDRLRMATMPKGARLILNPSSGAPGFAIENVFVMAGVPRIMHAMFDSLGHELGEGPVLLNKTVSCGLPEGVLAGALREIQDRFPNVEIGSYPFYQLGKFGTCLVARGLNEKEVDDTIEAIKEMVETLGGIAKVS